MRRVFVTLTVILMAGSPLFYPARAPASDGTPSEPTASRFVQFLEQNDYWRRASSEGSDAQPLTVLRVLLPGSRDLRALGGYDRIHVDYGNRRRERDPSHWVTILELRYRDDGDIPRRSRQHDQEYLGHSRPPGSELVADSSVFPLWRYRALVQEHGIEWKNLEYITWNAVRVGRTVFVVYTTPTMWWDEVRPMALRLAAYLRATTEAARDSLAAELRAHRGRSPVDYDTVADVQKLLGHSGFDCGPIDGAWGSSTEEALSAFLRTLELWPQGTRPSGSGPIGIALRRFQGSCGLEVTGRCDTATIRALARAWDQRR